jgi:hypothetical protein
VSIQAWNSYAHVLRWLYLRSSKSTQESLGEMTTI